MDIKELRKGNWLILREEVSSRPINEKYVQVVSIDEHKINGIGSKQYSSIPVTLGVLRQIGFHLDTYDDELEMTFLRFTVDDNPHYKLKAKRENGIDRYSLALFLGEHQLWPWIDTVHDLQNYFNVQNGQDLDLSFTL